MRGRNLSFAGPTLATLLFVVGGCAHPVSPVAGEPHLSATVPADVPLERPRLGVGRFVDARPRSDRVGRHPRLHVRWYGVIRRGERQTGDASFALPVSELVRRDAAATLARSGTFSEVHRVDVGDAEGQPAVPEGLDLVVVATIEELVGIQLQDFQVPFIPLNGYRNRLGPPSGMARVGYRLYDRRGLVLEERIDAVVESPAPTPTDAALDAVAETNERLAERLFAHLVPETQRVRRRIPLRVMDGCALGRERVNLLVGDASGVLEREAGIRLVPEWRRAERTRFENLEQALVASRRTRPSERELVLSLVRSSSSSTDRFGLSDPLGNHAVVACDAEGDVRVVTMAHEIGHLFGAVHVDDRASVMHPVAEFEGRFFDPLNREIVRTAWSRPIGGPLPRWMRERLETLYRAALAGATNVDRQEVHDLLAVLVP
jgi:hypothetical protein